MKTIKGNFYVNGVGLNLEKEGPARGLSTCCAILRIQIRFPELTMEGENCLPPHSCLVHAHTYTLHIHTHKHFLKHLKGLEKKVTWWDGSRPSSSPGVRSEVSTHPFSSQMFLLSSFFLLEE